MTHKFASQLLRPLYHKQSSETHVLNTSTSVSALWTVHTSVCSLQLQIMTSCTTERATFPKTAFLHVTLSFFSSICCAGGMGQLQTVLYGGMPFPMTYRYLPIGTFSVMQDFHPVMHSLSHTRACVIIYENGARGQEGKLLNIYSVCF